MATKKRKLLKLAVKMFDQGYVTGDLFKKFSKAVFEETYPEKVKKAKAAKKKKTKKEVKKVALEGRPGVKKPKKRTWPSVLYWSDIEDFVKKKYGKDFRDWAGKYSKFKTDESKEYQDFWHIMCDKCDISNDTTIWLFPQQWMEEENFPEWAKEVCEMLIKEFGSDFQAFVSW